MTAGDGSVEPDLALVDDPDNSRFDFLLDGRPIGRADYTLRGAVMVVPHTEIDPRFGGRGLGTEMVRRVLDEARSRNVHVVAACSFVAAFIRRNPGYTDLLAPTPR